MKYNKKEFLIQVEGFENQGEFDLALKKYEQILAFDIDDQEFLALLYEGKGRALTHLNQLDEALVECKKALELNPELPKAHGVLGYIYLVQGQQKQAEEEMVIALRLDPNNAITTTNLADLYLRSGCYKNASKQYEKLLELQPQNLATHAFLIQTYISQFSFQKSVTELNKLFKANPSMFIMHLLLIFANVITLSLSHLNIFIKLGLALGLYSTALLVPLFFSIPIGILFSVLIVSVIIANFWIGRYKGTKFLFLLFFSQSFICIVYWWLIWLGQYIRTSY